MENNLKYYNAMREVPKEAQKTIKGGRLSGMTDINPMWRIKKLTELFGPVGQGWYAEIVSKELVPCGEEIAAFVDIKLYVKYGEEWSKAIPGTGGAMFATKESRGIYVCDDAYKKAYTDAISVAAKALGVGADIYWQNDPTKYTSPARAQTPAPAEEPAKPPAAPKDETTELIEQYKAKLNDQVALIMRLTGKDVKIIKKYLCDNCYIIKPTTLEDYDKLIAFADIVIADNEHDSAD